MSKITSDRAPPKWMHFGTEEYIHASIISPEWQKWMKARRRERLLAKAQPVIDRDGMFCGICGGDVEEDELEIDHIIALANGGSSDLDNLQVSHGICNRRKSTE